MPGRMSSQKVPRMLSGSGLLLPHQPMHPTAGVLCVLLQFRQLPAGSQQRTSRLVPRSTIDDLEIQELVHKLEAMVRQQCRQRHKPPTFFVSSSSSSRTTQQGGIALKDT